MMISGRIKAGLLIICLLTIVVMLGVALGACAASLGGGTNAFMPSHGLQQGSLPGQGSSSSAGDESFGLSDYDTAGISLEAGIQRYIDALPAGTTSSVGYQKLDGSDTPHIVGSHGEMKTASVIKMYVAAMAMRANTASDHQLEQMISYSHNFTTNDLADSLGGLDELNAAIYDAGYPNTRMEIKMGQSGNGKSFWSSSADTLRFLSDLYYGRLNGEDDDQKLLGYMLNQQSYLHDNGSDGAPNFDAKKIRYAIEDKPGFIALANKTGENTGAVANDVAIVYTQKGDFLLTIYTMGGDNVTNVEFNRQVAGYVYDHMLGLESSEAGAAPSSEIGAADDATNSDTAIKEEAEVAGAEVVR